MSDTERQALSPEELAALQRYDAPTLANGIETFDVRPWTEGFMSPQIRCIFPEMGVMAGYAVTGKIRASKKGAGSYSRHGWWDAILQVPAPRVIVLEDVDDPPVGAFWGEVQTNIHKALGCIGTVTNGGVRDLNEVRAAGFQYFAASIMVSHAYVHLLDFGKRVTVGGVRVKTGDLVNGDQHGVQIIPLEIARELPAACEKIIARERTIIDFCRSPEFSLEGLKRLIP
jgi:4-hydroxy-4-methyl-2-oxoglutarate aldolase